MAVPTTTTDGDSESATLFIPNPSTGGKIPRDSFHFAYIVYFTLGAGYLLPWNALINAVDYFTHIYPGASINRTFAMIHLVVMLVSLLVIVSVAHKAISFVRINLGYACYLVVLVGVLLIDAWYVKERVGLYGGYYATLGLLAILGVAHGLVEGGVVGIAGELPKRYMQAVCVGNAASGVLVSVLRVITKLMYPQNAHGLRQSVYLYFIISIIMMIVNIIFYNVSHRLPVVKYYNDLKTTAAIEEKEQKGDHTGKLWKSALWDTVEAVKWYGFSIVSVYIVTLSIYPGSVTGDVHSDTLKDWYPIIIIVGYQIFDLIGKSLPLVYLTENAKVIIAASFARLLFLPLFYVFLHGPELLRTEIPIMILTCLLGLTNGYLATVLMILAPKTVQIQHSETAGIVIVLYLVVGLASGSILSWFWVL